VFARLKYESGVHRVQRVPETEASGRIHTSAATVAVLPEAEDIDVTIDEKDLQIDTYRSSGAGGQHVNKTDSAVRITHIPSGIVTQCQTDRSQYRNKSVAMSMLKSKLYAMKLKEKEQNAAASSSEKTDIAWGHQIRSYVLQPYQMVKDARTGHENGNAHAVLDGDIDEFLQSAISS
jgi:peptide chain release factor 2